MTIEDLLQIGGWKSFHNVPTCEINHCLNPPDSFAVFGDNGQVFLCEDHSREYLGLYCARAAGRDPATNDNHTKEHNDVI